MKRIFLLSLILCLSIESYSSVRSQSITCISIEESDGPFEELAALFSVYTEKIGSVASEEEYNSVKEEFNNALSELNDKYPGYEPSLSELKEIESFFSTYEEERSMTCERLEISDEGSSGDDEEINFYDEAVVDSIVKSYSNITDPVAKASAVLNDAADKFDEIYDFFSLLTWSSTIEAVIKRIDAFEDPLVNRALEDENSELAQIAQRIQTSMNNAIARISGESSDDEEEDAEQEFVSVDDESWSPTGFVSVDEAGETVPLEVDSEPDEPEQEFVSSDDESWSPSGFVSVDEAGETVPLEVDSEPDEPEQEFVPADDENWSSTGFKSSDESGDTSL